MCSLVPATVIHACKGELPPALLQRGPVDLSGGAIPSTTQPFSVSMGADRMPDVGPETKQSLGIRFFTSDRKGFRI
jgi:hypothetical protein